MNNNRSLRLIKFAGLALLTACMGASLANAQSAAGKFNLPVEVRWGQAVLPPGNYSFTVNSSSDSPPNTVLVRGEDRKLRIILSPAYDYSFSGKNEVTVERQGEGNTVRSLRLADVGLVIYFPAPKAKMQMLAQAPALIQRLPILMAQK